MLHVVKGYGRCCHGNYRAHMRIPDITLHVQLGVNKGRQALTARCAPSAQLH